MGEPIYKTYPKQFKWDPVHTDNNRVFFIMPFATELDSVYKTVEWGLEAKGYKCCRADKVHGSSIVVTDILQGILGSRYIVADLTGLNPNVLYELGIAHSFRDLPSVIAIRQAGDAAPFDIQGIRSIKYSKNDLAALIEAILAAMEKSCGSIELRAAFERLGGAKVTGEEIDRLIDDVLDHFKGNLDDVAALLDPTKAASLDKERAEAALRSFGDLVGCRVGAGDLGGVDMLVRVYAEMVVLAPVACDKDRCVEDFLGALSSGRGIPVDRAESLKIDFAIAVCSGDPASGAALRYLVDTLEKPKVTGVDLNRHKVERFFLESPRGDVEEAILTAIEDPCRHVREAGANVAGDRKLSGARVTLLRQLEKETDQYAARCILSALGKLGFSEDAKVIHDWALSREKELKATNATAAVIYAYEALDELCAKDDEGLVRDFEAHFDDMLAWPVIGAADAEAEPGAPAAPGGRREG